MVGSYTTAPRLALLELLAKLTPAGLRPEQDPALLWRR